MTLLYSGELAAGRKHLEQAIALYDPQGYRSQAYHTAVENPGVACLLQLARALWDLGYPDQALERSYAAITLAQELAHPFSLAWALSHAAVIHLCRREVPAARKQAEASMVLCREQGFPLYLAVGTYVRGWALAEQGEVEEGIVQMRRGLVAWEATGAVLGRPSWFAPLAAAYGKVGQAHAGLTLLAEALGVVQKTGERDNEAELYRLKGELTLQKFRVSDSTCQVDNPQSVIRNPQSEAEACFHKAIEIARRQQAKSLELRAVMSLSRLWRQQGKKDDARQMLAEIYGWFTEGFDTKDLQEAKALLEELV
jgi:predicted ATPase